MSIHDPWRDLREDWQGAPDFDVDALRRQVLRKQRRMAAFLAVELIATGAVLAQIAWLLMTAPVGNRFRLFLVCFGLIVVAAQALMLHLRRNSWRAAGKAPADLLRLTVRRACSGLRMVATQWIGVGIVFALLGFWLLGEWHAVGDDPAARQRIERAVFLIGLANGVVVAVFAAWTAWYVPRQRRQRARAEKLLRELGEDRALL